MDSPSVEHKVKLPVFRSLQAGRGIAALGVVFYHTEGLLTLPKYWNVRSSIFHACNNGVEFFFVLSGIVMLHAHWKDIGRPARLASYVSKRLKRIYPIYWVILLALLPMYFLVPGFGTGFERSPGAIADALLLLPIFQRGTIIPVAWTLNHEVMFYIVFGFLLWNKRVGAIVLGLWLGLSVLGFWIPASHPLLQVYLSPLHLLFAMGLLARVVWQRVSWKGEALAVLGVTGFLAWMLYDTLGAPPAWLLAQVYGLFATTAALGCMLIERHRPIPIPRAIMTLGSASYSLYLAHYAIISVAAKLLYPLWRHYPVPVAIPFLILISLAVTGGLLVHFFIEVPLLARMSGPRPGALAIEAATAAATSSGAERVA